MVLEQELKLITVCVSPCMGCAEETETGDVNRNALATFPGIGQQEPNLVCSSSHAKIENNLKSVAKEKSDLATH